MTSGRLIDKYTACTIMLDNLPQMWDSMRRSITQAGNINSMMTFAVLHGNMENELIARVHLVDLSTDSHALLTMNRGGRPQLSDRYGGPQQAKRPRLQFQCTPGATCGKCKKANHTAQQCDKSVDELDGKSSGVPPHLITPAEDKGSYSPVRRRIRQR